MADEKVSPSSADPKPLQSSHTENFPQLLDQLGISLLVTTYQAGKLVVVRADGEHANTHFRDFQVPMGLAANARRFALGTRNQIWEFQNAPAVSGQLEPAGRHDAVYVPRRCYVTGNIFVHEMAWADDELWIVNTRFSCLCVRDPHYSFVPRWQPPFITALAPEDRCHLNGLGIKDGRPSFVTALGLTDTAAGWGQNKKDGGILMEVPSGEVLLRGLSMPHSPRWFAGKLWLLESGTGSIGVVDRDKGRYEKLTRVPGFTRGLDFFGRLAFIGLSQVRQTAIFSKIPITERLMERTCGIWVVDIVSGQAIAGLRFEDGVEEIFAVHVLPGVRFPEVIPDNSTLINDSFVLPDKGLQA